MERATDPANPNTFWEQVTNEQLAPGNLLAQGDFIPRCSVPLFASDLDETVGSPTPVRIRVDVLDLIVMTQSCDLENKKATLVACCPINSLARFEESTPRLKKVGAWESVRQGRQDGLHLLGATTGATDKWGAYVVDFRSIFSLPVDYLTKHASAVGPRWRLRSPYLEHFSQAFARFFMRVGLPSPIPSYDMEPRRPPAQEKPLH